MTEILNTRNRKRYRSASNECNENQSKYFINQQIIDQNDANKMKLIHGKNAQLIKEKHEILFNFFFPDKTIKLLFKNANAKTTGNSDDNNLHRGYISKKEQFRENIRLLGNGQIVYLNDNGKNGLMQSNRKCNLCSKISSVQAIDCSNCNLEICESCGISCMQCNEPLCLSCVRLL